MPTEPQTRDRETQRRQLEQQVERLREHAARSTDSCRVTTFIAVSDEHVRERILDKLMEGHQFRRTQCVRADAVAFVFDCPPDVICLVTPTFLVEVDSTERRVRRIVDPFDLTLDPSSPTGSGASDGSPLSSMKAAATVSVPTIGAHALSLRTVAVTISGAPYRGAKIDNRDLAFVGDTAQAQVSPGRHRLDWLVQGWPGTEFVVSLEGARAPWSTPTDPKYRIGSTQWEHGFTDFDA